MSKPRPPNQVGCIPMHHFMSPIVIRCIGMHPTHQDSVRVWDFVIPSTFDIRHSSLIGLLLVALICLAQVGCVQRRMFINSNPPGATVWINDREVGTTPVATHFRFYGTHEIRLAKDGYETLTVQQPVRPPWYEIPPFDLVSENFVPGELRDTRSFSYNLQPRLLVPKKNLLGRAETMRQTHHSEYTGGFPQGDR